VPPSSARRRRLRIPSTGDIVNSLQPKAKFRSFDPNQAAKDAKQADLANRLQNAKTRQITVEERQEITEVVEENDLPAIDLGGVLQFRFSRDHA
jgi:hypothetical protein